MEFTVKEFTLSNFDEHENWYISDGNNNYLWKNLEIRRGTWCFTSRSWMGFYTSKAEAERYLMTYKVKHMEFIVRQSSRNPERGWYIITREKYKPSLFVHKDLELYTDIGWWGYGCGQTPGYYHTEIEAECYLRLFKEKYNMAKKIEIEVRINGVATSLREISEETLLKIRESSRPEPPVKAKPVPVFQVADCKHGGKRLILRVTEDIADRVGSYVGLMSDGSVGSGFSDMNDVDHYYINRRELKLDEV